MASNWNMAGESWDAAGQTSRNYRTRVRKMHGPVGVRPDPFFRGDARKYACTDCGHHKCSCADSAPPSAAQGEPASRAFKVGDRVVVADGRRGVLTSPARIAGFGAWLVVFDGAGARGIWTEGEFQRDRRAAPTPGTFEWLKTLPPDTLVHRRSWSHRLSHSARRVLRESHPVWLSATDWELA